MARPFQPTKIAGQQLVPTEQEAEFKLKTSSELFGKGYGQIDYANEIIETRQALSQLTDNNGFPLYTPEEVEQKVNSIIEQGFLGVYGTVEETKVDNTSPDPRVKRSPNQTLMQKAGEAFAQSTYKYGEFTVEAQQTKPYLLEQGLSESDADKYIVGYQVVYDSLRDQGLSHEEALKTFNDGMNEEEKPLQLLDPDKLHKPRTIVGGTDRTVFDKQIHELDKTPDLNNVQMVFQSAIKNLEVQNLANDYISNGDMDDPVEHIKIKVPGGPERGFYVPLQYLEYIESNKDYTTKNFSDFVYEKDIRNSDYEIVKEVKYSDMGSIESNVEELIETKDVFKPILAKINAEETLSHQPKDSWYLSEESREIVMANPTKFINEGILFDTSPGGGTIETDFHRALRTVFGVWGAGVEAAAPILSPAMLGATEYIGEPLSYFSPFRKSDPDMYYKDPETGTTKVKSINPFSDEQVSPLISDRKSFDYIMGAEERRQDYLESNYPQFAGSNIAERALAGFARGQIGLTLYTDVVRDEDYDLLTKFITGAPIFYADIKNPFDLMAMQTLGTVVKGFPQARAMNTIDKQFQQGGLGNITKEAVKEVLKTGADPLVKSGADLAESLMLPKKYTEPLKDITRPTDIRMSAGQKIRKEIEVREYVDLIQAEDYLAEASKIADELDKVYPNSALAKMLRKRTNVQSVLDNHAEALNAIPSLKKLDQQLDIVKRIEPGITVEKTVYNFKKSDEYKALNKTQKLEFNDAMLDVVKFVRKQKGHNTKLTAEDILKLKKHLQHRSSLMATIDIFPKGFKFSGAGRNIQRLTDSVFVDGKIIGKIEDAFHDTNVAKIFSVLASDPDNVEKVTRRAKQLEAEYARGAYDLSQVRNKNKMIYYNVTREQDMTAITFDKLDNDSINILKQEIDRLPIKRERKQQIFNDIDSGYITLKDQRYVTDVQLEDIAKALQLDLPADMFARLPTAEQKTLSKAVGDPGRGTVLSGFDSPSSLVANRYFDVNANATINRLRNETAKTIEGRIAKQTSKDSRTPNFFLAQEDLAALPQMQQKVFQELVNLVQSSKNNIKRQLDDVSENFTDYGLTTPPTTKLDELSAYIRGKNPNNNAGRLAQRSDLASMFNELIIRFIGKVETKNNVQMLDKFFDTKIYFTEPNYTTYGRDQLRLLSEEMADQFISNPTGLHEVFSNNAKRWVDTLLQEAKAGQNTILDNPLLRQDQSHLRGISGEELVYQFFEPRLIDETLAPISGRNKKTLQSIQDEAEMNHYLHAYYIQELFKAQQKLVDDFILPQLDDVTLKTLAPNVDVGRIEYSNVVKELTRNILNKEYNRNGDFETARQLLNGAMFDSKMAKNKKLRNIVSNYPQKIRDTLIDGDVQEFNRASKQVLKNEKIQIEKINDNIKQQIKKVTTEAIERRKSVANQRTPEARSLRLRTNAKEKEFKKKLARAKKAQLERLDQNTSKQLENLEAELISNTERYTNVAETNQDLLLKLYKEKVRTGVVKSNPKYDEMVKIREETPFIKPGEFNEDVFNLVDYVENVAKQNNLWNRPKITANEIASTLDNLFGTSNRLGQAYFGETQYNEFFKLYEQYGLHALNDTFNMFKKIAPADRAGELWQAYMGYTKPLIYNSLLAIRPRFLGVNVATASSITYATTGKISSLEELFRGTQAVWAGSNNQCSKFYEIAVTDPFGRSYTFGELYEGIVAGGVATDLSYARSVSLNDRQFLRRMKQETNRNMGLGQKVVNKLVESKDNFFEFPIQSDMVFRVANAITSIKQGENFTDAMKSAKVSMLDYTAINKMEQELQHLFIFYNFTRQMTTTAFMSFFNAEAAARAAKIVRFNEDIEATERLMNDGRVYPYNRTLPDYQQVRAGFLLHKRNMANKDVWVFSPPVPLIESYSILFNLVKLMMTTATGKSNQQALDTSYNRFQMLLNPLYKDLVMEKRIQPNRVPPHVVGTLKAITPDQDTLEQYLSFYSCEKIQGQIDFTSIYAVDNMVYPMTPSGQKALFECNQGIIRELLKIPTFLFKLSTIDVAWRDYYNVISGVGTPYEDLSLTMKLTSGIGLTTPSNVTKPVVGELEQHQRRMELLREPQRELKRQEESRGLK